LGFGAGLLAVLLLGRSRPVVVKNVVSTDNIWKADIVAVRKLPLGTFDAELRLFRNEKPWSTRIIMSGRDAVQDIEMKLRSLEIQDHILTMRTKGNFGPAYIEQKLP
jgi:hypothetical protein